MASLNAPHGKQLSIGQKGQRPLCFQFPGQVFSPPPPPPGQGSLRRGFRELGAGTAAGTSQKQTPSKLATGERDLNPPGKQSHDTA